MKARDRSLVWGVPRGSVCNVRQGEGEKTQKKRQQRDHGRQNIVNNSNYISDSMNYSYLVNSLYISNDSNSYELMG